MWYAHSWAGDFNKKDKLINTGTNYTYERCPFVYRELSILWNGDVVPCCYDLKGELLLAMLITNNNSIKEIWNRSKMGFIRKTLDYKRHYEVDLCKGCSSYSKITL